MRYGLIGEKLGHSFSKTVHEELADYTYSLIPLNRDEFSIFMEERDFNAINVTIPYKEMVFDYLHHVDEKAKKIGAVNTIVNKDGKLFGYNTDYDGFLYMLKKHNLENAKGKKVLILGKGGTAKTCKTVFTDLESEIHQVYYKSADGFLTYDDCYLHHKDAHIIVNTTPVGMYPNTEKSPIDLKEFNNLECVVDVVYNPMKTQLLVEAESMGINIVGGMEMLVAQAKFAVEIFTNNSIDNESINNVYRKIASEKANIVLIGMSGSGKTDIGIEIAKKMGRKFIDSDEVIVEKLKMPIANFFEEYGEAPFRVIESEILEDIAKENNLIIATGGGVIKDKNNILSLRKNGLIFWLHRTPDLLEFGNGRPLAKTSEATEKLYHERYPIYEKSAHIRIENKNDIETCVNDIISAYKNHFNI